jgi:ribosome-binding factor A
MNPSIRWQTTAAALCAEPGPDDGIDPRREARGRKCKPSQRKDLQLCKEAERILSLVLAGDTADPLLRELRVLKVEPEGGGRQLCATVAHANPCDASEAEILAALAHSQGRLRAELARSIHRKRVPLLKFRYAGVSAGG